MAESAPAATNLTVDQFMQYATPDGKAELVRGELVVTPPPGAHHGIVAVNLTTLLHLHASAAGLGRVFAETSFELVQLPRTVRAPDVAFVRKERLAAAGIGAGPVRGAPDLAVEILSPSESASRLSEKLDDYAAAGVALVWVILPERRTVMVASAEAPTRWVREPGMLEGADVIAGFSCSLSDLFAGVD